MLYWDKPFTVEVKFVCVFGGILHCHSVGQPWATVLATTLPRNEKDRFYKELVC